MKIVPLTREILKASRWDRPDKTVRGLALIDDEGKVRGVAGGVRVSGSYVVFMDVDDEIRNMPLTMVRLGKALQKLPHKFVYAHCDPNIEAAGRYLEHFGFTPRGDGYYYLEK